MKWMLVLSAAAFLGGCGGGDSGSQCGEQMVLDEQSLDVVEVRLYRGRCLGHLVIRPQGDDAKSRLVAIAQTLAAAIPADGSAPASDAQLVTLVPDPGQVGDGTWQEDLTDQVEGPWLVSTSAYDWIDGAGKPFEDNGFQAASGETYQHQAPDLRLTIELVDQGSCAGAEAAFRDAGWNEGTPVE